MCGTKKTGVVLATFTCDGSAHCRAFFEVLELIASDAGGRVHFLRLEKTETQTLTRSLNADLTPGEIAPALSPSVY